MLQADRTMYTFVDPRGMYHVIKKARKYSYYVVVVVVVCRKHERKSYLTTAYY